MPTYLDIHDLPGAVTAEDLAKAHNANQQVQGKDGVEYHKYWVNRKNGKLFCMCTAPSAEAAAAVHQEAHGMTALKIIEVMPIWPMRSWARRTSVRMARRYSPEAVSTIL